METMSERLGYSELGPQEVIERALGILADNMRLSDQLKAHEKDLLDNLAAAGTKLEGLDIEIPAEEQAQELAYGALGLVIIQRRLEPIQKQIKSLEFNLDNYVVEAALRHRKIHVRSLTGEPIGTSINDVGMSQWYEERKGKFQKVNMLPHGGGFLEFRGLRGSPKTYSAQPLIDRDNDYQPAFSIEIL